MVKNNGGEIPADLARRETKDEVGTVLRLMAALSCNNVQTLEFPAPLALNKKRMAKSNGATPFYTYKILDVVPPSVKTDGTACGVHTSPRAHLRRGHIRRLPTGTTTWVQSCMVGSASAGTVEKDYRLRRNNI